MVELCMEGWCYLRVVYRSPSCRISISSGLNWELYMWQCRKNWVLGLRDMFDYTDAYTAQGCTVIRQANGSLMNTYIREGWCERVNLWMTLQKLLGRNASEMLTKGTHLWYWKAKADDLVCPWGETVGYMSWAGTVVFKQCHGGWNSGIYQCHPEKSLVWQQTVLNDIKRKSNVQNGTGRIPWDQGHQWQMDYIERCSWLLEYSNESFRSR